MGVKDRIDVFEQFSWIRSRHSVCRIDSLKSFVLQLRNLLKQVVLPLIVLLYKHDLLAYTLTSTLLYLICPSSLDRFNLNSLHVFS